MIRNIKDAISAWLGWLLVIALFIAAIIELVSILISWANRPPVEPKHQADLPAEVAPPWPANPDTNKPEND